ncbi:MAG TPA: hypothetical protein VMJ65_16905 [Solirubrobacteraceae bacterium]|nr:hypothetical protein [Solirubrobacteraceae bacterium]
MFLLAGLAVLVIGDAGAASQLAWLGAGTAALLVTAGMVAQSPAPVHAAVAVLGVLFLLRHDARLLLAPAYGAGLLVMDDLAIRTMELSGVGQIATGAIMARITATLAVAALGACVSAVAALAVTAAVPRTLAVTAVGVLAVVAAFVGLVILARRRFGSSLG